MCGLTSFREVLLGVLLVYRVNTVSCQVKVQGFIGDGVLLPCVYSGADPLPETVSIYWRDEDNGAVLNVENNIPDLSTQSLKFKGRVFSFPDLYKKGNFSIVMRPLQLADSGPYECHVPAVDLEQRFSLVVSGKRVAAATPPPGPSGGAAGSPDSLHCILLSLPLSLLFTSFK